MNLTVFDEKLAEYCGKNGVSGEVRLTSRDEILYDKFFGFADADARKPFVPGARFTLYSITKPFTAMGLLRLYDEGRVDMDDHPAAYVPEARGFDSRVTVRQLLHHESGLPDFMQTAVFAEKHPKQENLREELIELSAYPSFFAPGTGSRYSNINFVLCALIIENVSGMKYADYMKETVLNPLGMKTAVFDDGMLTGLVQGSKLIDGTPVSVNRTVDYLYGAGDLTGTAEDVYALNRAIKQKLLLRPETWTMALTPAPVSGFGMGCYVGALRGHKYVKHTGGHTGFRNLHLHVLDEDIDLIALLNCENGETRDAITEIMAEEIL